MDQPHLHSNNCTYVDHGCVGCTPGKSRLCAGSHQPQHFPWSEHFPSQLGTTAPVRQAQAAKWQSPVG